MKFLGFRRIRERNYIVIKNEWLQFCTGFRKLNFEISPAGYFDNRAHVHFSTIWGQWYIKIPFIKSKYDESDPPRYGFYFFAADSWWPDTFVWCWKRKTYHYNMPWSLTWVRTSYLRKDGQWEHDTKPTRLGQTESKNFWDKEKWENVFWSETYPYTHVTKKGVVQHVDAKVMVEEMEWRPIWFKWTSAFALVRRSIDIEFSDEVGDRRGSWKGGTLGCGYTLKPNETPLLCLRRMEIEREFN